MGYALTFDTCDFLVAPALRITDFSSMQSHLRSIALKRKKSKWQTQWEKIGKKLTGLYRYRPSQMYYARVRSGGKVYRECLKTKDLEFAKRKLVEFKKRLDRTDVRFGKITLVRWLEEIYFPTLRGSAGALKAKKRIIERVKAKWVQARTQPMRDLKESELVRFLTAEYGQWSSGYWNSAMTLLRAALAMAERDHVIFENPAGALKYRRRSAPVRLTPTFDQFQAIVADVRAQPFNADAWDSADFLEACGLLGLGQAEIAGMKREHIDLESGRIIVHRHKTDTGFTIPIYPQARALIERLAQGRRHSDHIFKIAQSRKALTNACRRLSYPRFTHRSLRRMFITRAIERGVDIKVIAQWQGHRDGGKLILDTYSHVRPEHGNRMAALMTTERPANVIPISQSEETAS
jgi:integrase